ncbi:hypothetical protein [Pseudochryseolinea flava]|uniref:Uncharacterized protein n=1 Tax=Pseudochryseolinea flava TaxID=2059302 RepID=A0A364Y011_9BACT|nr:hypothetical protein [Pseudochryseolinea flava]RAW00114.1 hypothetical protein DQQ10_16320 [Pseudochryseolinea flava]
MKQTVRNIEHEILHEVMNLMEKTGFESFTAVTTSETDSAPSMEATLVNIKSLSARYDKQDAVIQVRALMEKYNIQLDELVENISS